MRVLKNNIKPFIIVGLIVILMIGAYVLLPYRVTTVDGVSMHPTLTDGSVLLVKKTTNPDLSPNDIVLFTPPLIIDEPVIKRVIATNGDTVVIQNNQVTVNGEVLNEPYARGVTRMNDDSNPVLDITVPEGHIFVLGDQREHSTDSRHFGTVPVESVTHRFIKTLLGEREDN